MSPWEVRRAMGARRPRRDVCAYRYLRSENDPGRVGLETCPAGGWKVIVTAEKQLEASPATQTW